MMKRNSFIMEQNGSLKSSKNSSWTIVYKRAYNDDNSLFFPEKLTEEFLNSAKRTMGSYLFSNQYLNEVIPSDKQTFKREWIKYYSEVPKNVYTFVFVDPALSETATSDYTGIVVVSIDHEKRWYVRYAQRHELSPTELVQFLFRINDEYSPMAIGIESVAYQKALLYFTHEEGLRRNKILPLKEVKAETNKTKPQKIRSLVPRYEWNHIFHNHGLHDLEMELMKFPRGAHDDLIDALACIEYISHAPDKESEEIKKPHSPAHPDWEKWIIQQKYKGANNE
jgi:phage terminase large subunit-like protein